MSLVTDCDFCCNRTNKCPVLLKGGLLGHKVWPAESAVVLCIELCEAKPCRFSWIPHFIRRPDDLGWLRAAERDLSTNTVAPWTCPAQFVQPGASVGLAQGYGYGACASTGGLIVSY